MAPYRPRGKFGTKLHTTKERLGHLLGIGRGRSEQRMSFFYVSKSQVEGPAPGPPPGQYSVIDANIATPTLVTSVTPTVIPTLPFDYAAYARRKLEEAERQPSWQSQPQQPSQTPPQPPPQPPLHEQNQRENLYPPSSGRLTNDSLDLNLDRVGGVRSPGSSSLDIPLSESDEEQQPRSSFTSVYDSDRFGEEEHNVWGRRDAIDWIRDAE